MPLAIDEGILLRPTKTRRIYITKDDVEKMGPTPGCRGCISITRGGPPRNHNEDCRTRMETANAAYDGERYDKALSRYAEARFAQDEDSNKSIKVGEANKSKHKESEKKEAQNK